MPSAKGRQRKYLWAKHPSLAPPWSKKRKEAQAKKVKKGKTE